MESSLDTLGATPLQRVETLESCDGKFVPGYVSGDCSAGGPAWFNRIWGLYRFWSSIQNLDDPFDDHED